MRKAIIALALGTFGLGMSEFSMMGILPDIASSMNITIPQAGHFISAYAIGVAVGAPALILLARNVPLKKTLLLLTLIYFVGNLCFAVSSNYWLNLFFRFVSGLPHGAFFGVGSVVAQKIAKPGKETSAIAGMIAGMTVANLIGVPMATFISHQFKWSVTYLLIAALAIAIFYFIKKWVPALAPLPNVGGIKGQFRFLKKRGPWLIIIVTIMGNGGIFAWYSYINPLMTHVSGFSESAMTGVMIFAGLGTVFGNIIGGSLGAKFLPEKVGTGVQGIAVLLLLGIFFFADIQWLSFILMFLTTACLFAVSAPQQFLLLENSKGSELLGGACVQVAFNLGNALGAFTGGIPIEMKYPYNYTALPGAALALVGFLVFLYYCIYTQKQRRLQQIS